MKGQLKELLLIATLLTLLNVGCAPSATPVPPTPAPPTPTPAPLSMTVTFSGGTCSAMNLPPKVPLGTTLAINWVLVDKYDFPGLCAITLDKGKTIDDLKGLPGYPQPSWVHPYYCWENPGSGMTVNVELKTGPIYLVCFSSRTTTIGNAMGPIEVGQ